ncbi:arginyl-tRNA synthetase [Agromyces hippuratus]|uniref:Arginine--tRNA ligase n=1 Tax=Agromyces hippuratus TaxID=286438 RepID=A0A852X1H4_9MICO|nr:arginine--tRNA ligase [Agromyces hippuratus]NYG22003.1 arginyl-tRNA synthetase [Agromyces hippuratus]
MESPTAAVASVAAHAIAEVLGVEPATVDPVIRESRFADLQSNAALSLGPAHGLRPRDLAQQVVERIPVDGPIARAEVTGPGYVNLELSTEWIAERLSSLAVPERHDATGRRIVIDYSSPNVAKEMHVGHLRTTVVGDALARMLEWSGHTVIRQNHIGDWGTPFGMLIEHSIDLGLGSAELDRMAHDPNAFYRAARAKFDASPAFAERARRRVVLLQAGDAATLERWAELVDASKAYFRRVYASLDVSLTDEHLAGESSYNDELAGICAELEALGLARVSDGALCAFPEGFTGRDGAPAPLIIRKRDGGYGYATTDLATIRYRVTALRADQAVYVIGEPQATHLEMVWAVAREAGWLPPTTATVHVKIGNVVGADNKLLRTRSGDGATLAGLIDEAYRRAAAATDREHAIEDDDERGRAARAVAIGAIKYADLSVPHDTGYMFDLDRMLAPVGNTGPYLQYAVTRVRSVFSHAGSKGHDPNAAIALDPPEARELALLLLHFDATARAAAESFEPHRLCALLHQVAKRFAAFYDAVPILRADPTDRDARLRLCRQTEAVLVRGLDLLGISAPLRM